MINLIFVYLFVVFVLIPLVIPYYSYFRSQPSFVIPKFLDREIDEINKTSVSNLEYLKNIYNLLTRKYYGDRIGSVFAIVKSFKNTIKEESGLLPCNIFNELIKTILVKSERFKESEIKRVVVPLNFFIHQYLKVKVDGNWVNIDPTYNKMGVKFGEKAILLR